MNCDRPSLVPRQRGDFHTAHLHAKGCPQRDVNRAGDLHRALEPIGEDDCRHRAAQALKDGCIDHRRDSKRGDQQKRRSGKMIRAPLPGEYRAIVCFLLLRADLPVPSPIEHQTGISNLSPYVGSDADSVLPVLQKARGLAGAGTWSTERHSCLPCRDFFSRMCF